MDDILAKLLKNKQTSKHIVHATLKNKKNKEMFSHCSQNRNEIRV